MVKILMVQFNFQEPCQWLIVVKILMVTEPLVSLPQLAFDKVPENETEPLVSLPPLAVDKVLEN
jgi:hypothetical protein